MRRPILAVAAACSLMAAAPAHANHSAPTGLAVTDATSSTVTVTWDEYTAFTEASFTAQARTSPNTTYFQQFSVPDEQATYTGLAPSTTYYFRVQAVSGSGHRSDWSAHFAASTASDEPTPTPTPTPTETPTPTPTPTPDPDPTGCGDTADWSFGAGTWTSTGRAWPAGGDLWRPYSDASPFNQCVPANPPLEPDSAAMISRLRSFGNPQNMQSKPSNGQDWQHPIYFADPTRDSRVLTIHCQKYGSGNCSGIEGLQVRVPAGAQIASGTDQHIGIAEPLLGRYRIVDIYNAGTSVPSSGTWNVGAGALTWLDELGIQPDTRPGADAAGWGLMVGMVRGQDFQQGTFQHALFAVIRCTNGSTWPTVRDANGNYRLARQCTQTGDPMDGPRLGDWIYLAMTDTEIDQLTYTTGAPLHPSARTYLHALQERGMFIGDTGGTEFGKPEAGISYTSMGASPPLHDVGVTEGWPTASSGYRYLPVSQLPWSVLFDRLRVIDHCVTDPAC